MSESGYLLIDRTINQYINEFSLRRRTLIHNLNLDCFCAVCSADKKVELLLTSAESKAKTKYVVSFGEALNFGCAKGLDLLRTY